MNLTTALRSRWSGRRASRGQALVEFALIVPGFTVLLLGMLEFGLAFNHNLTLVYATREGARVGAALVNGGGTVGCNSGQSPNAVLVDPQIVASVSRIIESPSSPIVMANVSQIRIYQAQADGTETSGKVDVWIYAKGAGPVVDGKALDFSNTGQTAGWTPCNRNPAIAGGNPPPLIGVEVRYAYHYVTPMEAILGAAGVTSLTMNDHTTMYLEPTN